MSILDTIDGALRDYETSGDAMRWAPEEKRAASPGLPLRGGQISLDGSSWLPVSSDSTPLLPAIIDTSQFDAALRQLGEQIAELMRPCREFAKSIALAMAPITKVLNEVKAERVSAMHREYHRRSRARRRRR